MLKKITAPKKMTISKKLILTVYFWLILVTTLAGILFLRQEQVLLRREYEKGGQEIAAAIAVMASQYMTAGNLSDLMKIINTIGAYRYINYLAITDKDGRILLANGEYSRSEGGNQDIIAPIASSGGATVGYVRLALDYSGTWQKYLEDVTGRWLLWMLAAILIAGLLAGRWLKRLLRPLTDLTNTAELIAAGDLSYRMQSTAGDELGELATAFNTMSLHLANLVQTVRASIVDAEKGMERLQSVLQGAEGASNNFLGRMGSLKENMEEKLKAMTPVISHADRLLYKLQQVEERQKAAYALTNEIRQIGKEVEAFGKEAVDKWDDISSGLKASRQVLVQILARAKDWLEASASLTTLGEELAPFTVEVAVEAAKTGNAALADAAKKLKQTLQTIHNYLRQFRQELKEVIDTCGANCKYLEESIEQGDRFKSELKHNKSREQKLCSLLQEKDNVEGEIREEIERLVQSSRSLTHDLSENISALTKLFLEDLKDPHLLLPINWQEIFSLVQKLLRITERLQALTRQYKT